MQIKVRALKVLSDSLSATLYHTPGVSINAQSSFRWIGLDLTRIWIELYKALMRVLRGWVLVLNKMAPEGIKCSSPSFNEIIASLSLTNCFGPLKLPADQIWNYIHWLRGLSFFWINLSVSVNSRSTRYVASFRVAWLSAFRVGRLLYRRHFITT